MRVEEFKPIIRHLAATEKRFVRDALPERAG